MNCPKCNAEIPEKFKFCPECGTAVSSESRASGLERDRSLGELRTAQGPAPDGNADEMSLGDMRTKGAAPPPSSEAASWSAA